MRNESQRKEQSPTSHFLPLHEGLKAPSRILESQVPRTRRETILDSTMSSNPHSGEPSPHRFRGLLPTPKRVSSTPTPSAGRRVVKSACNPCRQRRIKVRNTIHESQKVLNGNGLTRSAMPNDQNAHLVPLAISTATTKPPRRKHIHKH